MNISRDSWHYKMMAKTFWGVPRDLCSYVRKLVFMVTGYALLATIAVALVTSGIFTAVVHIDHWTLNLLTDYYNEGMAEGSSSFASLFFKLGHLFWAVGLILGAVFMVLYGFHLHDRIVDNRTASPKEPGLIATYAKSIKDKTCVMLNFVDESKQAS